MTSRYFAAQLRSLVSLTDDSDVLNMCYVYTCARTGVIEMVTTKKTDPHLTKLSSSSVQQEIR
ncbi:hypothetical protein Droror1_Dr00021712 [Drosera rotundifolia]